MKLNFERKEVEQWIKKLDNGGSSAVVSAFKDWLILADEVERQAKLIERLVEDAERLAERATFLDDVVTCHYGGEDKDNKATLDQHNALMEEIE